MTLEKRLMQIHSKFEEHPNFKGLHPIEPDLSDYLKMKGLLPHELTKHVLDVDICPDLEEAEAFIEEYAPMTDESICEWYQDLMNSFCYECGIIKLKSV